MDFLKISIPATGIFLVMSITFAIIETVLEATGYNLYVTLRKDYTIKLLEEQGFSKKSLRRKFIHSLINISIDVGLFIFQLLLSLLCKDVSPPSITHRESQSQKIDRKVQELFSEINQNSSKEAKKQWQDSIRCLKILTQINPSHNSYRLVNNSLLCFKNFINSKKLNDTDLLEIIEYKEGVSRFSWYLKNYQKEYLLIPLRDLIDYSGRGTTIGLLIGFTIALAQKDPLGLTVTTFPIIGAIFGAIAYGLKFSIAMNKAQKSNWVELFKRLPAVILIVILIFTTLSAYFIFADSIILR